MWRRRRPEGVGSRDCRAACGRRFIFDALALASPSVRMIMIFCGLALGWPLLCCCLRGESRLCGVDHAGIIGAIAAGSLHAGATRSKLLFLRLRSCEVGTAVQRRAMIGRFVVAQKTA